ncbi:N-acetyl-glucosamine-6-phosphate deacetylase, partial [Tieghemiomyces parasiticus]
VAYYAHPTGAVIVTDAMSALGLDPGMYSLGKMTVEKFDDRVYLEGTETLAGNVVNMEDSVKNFQRFTGCTTVEVLEAATLHPARVLGITATKGTLAPGADADLLFLDDDLTVRRVFVAGEEVSLLPAEDDTPGSPLDRS